MISVPTSLTISSWTPETSGIRPALFPDNQTLTVSLVPNTTASYLFTWQNINGHTRKMTLVWNSGTSSFTGSPVTIVDQHTSIYANLTVSVTYDATDDEWIGSLATPEFEPTGAPGTFVAQATGGQDPDGPEG